MSTAELDYSNTIIYKITCKDPNITDKYVGHTIDFVKRRYAHSNNAQSEKSPNYNLKLYKFIRDNGGWNNWKMEIVNFYNCNNLREAKEKEQEHYVELQATLNSIEPLKSKCDIMDEIPNDINTSNFYCKDCNVACCKQNDWQRHLSSKKHNREHTDTKFRCEICDTGTDNKKDFGKHLATAKHKKKSGLIKPEHDLKDKPPLIVCANCNASYKSRVGLWYHLKKCEKKQPEINNPESKTNPDYDADVIRQLLCQNSELLNTNNEFKNFIIEQSREHKKETLDIINKMLENFTPFHM